MRLKLFLLLSLMTSFALLAQRTGVHGVVVDAKTGVTITGATVILDDQGTTVTTGPNGDFSITNATAGQDVLHQQHVQRHRRPGRVAGAELWLQGLVTECKNYQWCHGEPGHDTTRAHGLQ